MDSRIGKGGTRMALPLAVLIFLGIGSACKQAGDEAESPNVPVAPVVRPQAAAYLVQAQQVFRTGDFTTALAFADSAEHHAGTESTAFLADVSFLRAHIFAELNRPDSAEAAYNRVLALDSEYKGAWLNLGNSAFRQGRYSEALAAYRREQAGNPDPKNLTYLGRTYAELGKIDSARIAYEQAIEADASQPEAYVRLGQLYEQNGEFEAALPYARRAHELAPTNPGYQYLLGTLLLRSGKPEEALDHLADVVVRWPKDHNAHYNLGQALIRVGRPDQGRRHLAAADSLRAAEAQLTRWETMTRLHSDNPAVWSTYAYALDQAGHDTEALRAYNAALYLDPTLTEVRFAVANLYVKQGDLNTALTHYQTVLRQDSTFVGAWLNAGIAHARSGQVDAARRAWQAVLRYEPNHPQARAYLASLERN